MTITMDLHESLAMKDERARYDYYIREFQKEGWVKDAPLSLHRDPLGYDNESWFSDDDWFLVFQRGIREVILRRSSTPRECEPPQYSTCDYYCESTELIDVPDDIRKALLTRVEDKHSRICRDCLNKFADYHRRLIDETFFKESVDEVQRRIVDFYHLACDLTGNDSMPFEFRVEELRVNNSDELPIRTLHFDVHSDCYSFGANVRMDSPDLESRAGGFGESTRPIELFLSEPPEIAFRKNKELAYTLFAHLDKRLKGQARL